MRSPVEHSAAGGPGPGRRQGTAAEDTASGVCEPHPIEACGRRVPSAVVIRTFGTDIGALRTIIGALGTDIGTLRTIIGALGTDIGTLRTIIGTLGTDIGILSVIKHPLIDGRL